MTHLLDYLTEPLGPEPGDRLIELRVRRRASGMQQSFYSSRSLAEATRAITTAGERTDVYVGVVPRGCQTGGKRAIQSVSTLWADCDDPRSRRLLATFRPAPSIVVRSGPTGRHAYWLLDEAVTPDQAEAANRRLAGVLGADPQSTDAARILRPPGTHNFKYTPPTSVEVERFEPVRVAASAVVGALPTPEPPTRVVRLYHDHPLRQVEPAAYVRVLLGVDVPRHRKIICPFHELSVGGADAAGVLPARSLADASLTDDPLRLVPPPVYFERLTGLRVGPSGKLHCLFHDDQSPSLHVYRERGRGWYCFGCGRGGSVFDLAALLWGRGTRGSDFVELRRVLERLLL